MYSESDKTYNLLLKEFNREEGLKIAKYIFGMILLPLEVNRKVFPRFLIPFIENY